jgi:putative DNA primase/helicase
VSEHQADLTTVSITLADGTILPGCRPDLVSLGDLLARGWSVIPVRHKSKIPSVRWEEFQRRHATVDEHERWFSRQPFNVGIVTGKISGIFVVDCDSAAAVAWAGEHLPPCDLRVRTAKGLHLYFPYSGERPMRNKVRVRFDGRPLDIDFRADGGYVVGPGSVHENGHVYAREGDGWTWR